MRVPGGNKSYVAPAVLNYPEIENEGQMADSGVINWVLVTLHFAQIDVWAVA